MIEDFFSGILQLFDRFSSEPVAAVIGLLLLLVYLVSPWILLWQSHRRNRAGRLMDALPTSKVKGVFIGLVEVKGIAEMIDPMSSYLAGKECVWYKYEIEEQWRRLVTEIHTDSKGHTSTRVRVETGWTTVDSNDCMKPFHLVDETGKLLVRPVGADVEGDVTVDIRCGRDHPMYYGKGPSNSICDSTHTRRFKEEVIPAGSRIYLVGEAREREDVVAPEITYSKQAPMFLLSTRDELAISDSRKMASWGYFMAGFLLIVGVPWFIWYQGHYPDLMTSIKTGDYPVWMLAGVLYLVCWCLSWMWIIYNMMVDIRNRAMQAESQVDVLLKRRHDLIPRLVDVVSAYTSHEQFVQQNLAALRSGADGAVIGREQLLALSEAYPGLKAQPLFGELSKQLRDTEDRIALAREYLNTIVNHYNTLLQIFPEGVIARTFGLRPFASK